MNNCRESGVAATEPESRPVFFPVADRDGWYPVNADQPMEALREYFVGQARERRERVVERFEAAMDECEGDPAWAELSKREKVARLLAAVGFEKKAERYRDCQVTGIPVDCPRCGERYFFAYRCTLRYCEHCGPLHFSRFMDKYCEPIARLIAAQPSQRGRTLAMLTFTVRACDRMPPPDEPRRLMNLVRKWFKRTMPRGALWGCIFAVETGHELAVRRRGRQAGGWNLHVHALYYGPFLDWAVGLKLWKELTQGDGQGFYIKQCPGWRHDSDRAVRRAMVRHFRYVMKPAAVSAERVAALEVLFFGIRRVHALGRFYRLPKPQRIPEAPCPNCGQSLPINRRAWHRSERSPVDILQAEGRRDFRKVEAEMRRAGAFAGGP